MIDEKAVIRVLLRHYWKKGLTAAAATREICNVEGTDVLKENTAQWWFRRFNQGDTSLEDQERSGRPSVVNKEEFRALVEQQPSTSTRRLSEELGHSQSTIVRHLHNMGFVNKNPLRVPHELTNIQAQRRVDLCRKLLDNPRDSRFWKRIVTGDEKWVFFRNSNGGKQWLQPGQPAQQVVSSGRFEKKVMLCVWWNYEGPVHWELVPDGRAIDGNLYADQLQRVLDALSTRYPALLNRGRAILQHDNAPAHTSRRVKQKIQELQGIEVIPHPAYSPDLAPSDYHLFRSLSHFLRGRRFSSEEEVKTGIAEFFASKTPDWYRHGIEQLAERWLRVIENDGLYFEE
jgi:histone-lysine N-methyltransferase SETMAR